MMPTNPSYSADGLQPARVVADLTALRQLTGDADGAQRVAWTEIWQRARAWERERLADLPVTFETDEAGNQWVTLRGRSDKTLLIGGHIDSIPNGGWLDGCLNLIAGYEVLRHLASQVAQSGEPPPVTVRLVDWADEEGRFGYSLLGSGLAAGTVVADQVRHLTDKDGCVLGPTLAANGVDLDQAHKAQRQLQHAAAYVELHIEQGPVLESLNLPPGVVLGTFGVERHRIRFVGQSAHAGATPMHLRRDALAAAAKFELAIRDIAVQHGGVCTVGHVSTKPGVMTAVVGQCDCTLDQRHLDAATLATMLHEAKAASEQFAREERVSVEWLHVFSVAPVHFNPDLINMGDEAVRAVAGVSHRLPSGPLHDATEVARAGIPTVMLFVQSLNGLSHAKEEDTLEEHILLSVQALDRLVFAAMAWLA